MAKKIVQETAPEEIQETTSEETQETAPEETPETIPEELTLEEKLKTAFETNPIVDRFYVTPDEELHHSNYAAVSHQINRCADVNAVVCHERPEEVKTEI